MENLPEELKLEILLLLPVRSLLSLKCVSKSWRSIISNPNFAKLHLQLSNYSQYPNRILIQTSPQTRSIDINASLHNDSDTFNLVFPPPIKPYTEVYIMGSCRGIVLLHIEQQNNPRIIMWNPSTGSYKHIPLPHRFILPISFAFCYDESLDDYFIGLSDIHLVSSEARQAFEVLSLRTNSWEKLDLTHHFRTHSQDHGTVFNGAIHFTANFDDGSCTSPEVIAFDIKTKGLRKVPLPIDTNIIFPGLGIHKGFLALTCVSFTEIVVWVMREYGVKSSWTKLFSLSRDKSGIGYIQPLVFFKGGDEFVTSYLSKKDDEGLSKWNDKGELLEHRAYGSDLRKRYSYVEWWRCALAYTETLLPLP